LRKLNLVSSIEKTSIIESSKAKEELFFEENDRLTELEDELKTKLKAGNDVKTTIKEVTKYYNKLIRAKKDHLKNWSKVLKRFYSLCVYSKSNFFFDKLINHLNEYPLLFSGDKITKYLLQNKEQTKFNEVIGLFIDYLYSQENLYPSVESNILEMLLVLDQDFYSQQTLEKIKQLGLDIFFSKNNYKSLSDYARAISCLLLYKFDHENLDKITNHYLKTNEKDGVLRKYLIFVSLTVGNQPLQQKVIEKARKEQNLSINRLVNFVDNINNYKDLKVVKDYLKRDKIIITFDKKKSLTIEQSIKPVRSDVLNKIIEIYKK